MRLAWTATFPLILACGSAVPVRDAQALEATLPVTNVVTITSGMGGSRVLVDFASPAALAEELILSAHLVIPLSGNTPVSNVGVAAMALTTPWGPGATWTSPWSAPGGDVDRTLVAGGALEAGRVATVLDLDVTDLVRAIVDGEVGANGLLLKPADITRAGFSGAEVAVLGPLQGGDVHVVYRSLTSHGMRGGAKSLTERRRHREQAVGRGG
jgi:hypothetical protein